MKNTIKKIITNFEEIFSSVFLIITTLLVILNVFLRYFLKTGIYWSEEVATGCFVWSVFLGSAAGFKRKMHVGVDFLLTKTPPQYQKIIKIIIDVLLLAITSYATYIAIIYEKVSYKKPTPVLGISSAFISSAILLSFALMSIYSIRFLIQDIQKIKKGELI